MNDVYEKVTELARRRGYVWPTSEIYGSVAGLIDYGPLGSMLKRRIEQIWRQFYVVMEGCYEIECPTIGQESIYIASGHVKGFSDKMCQCPHCNEFLRADHVAIAGQVKGAATLSEEALAEALWDLPCPACEKILGSVTVFQFNLMFTTTIGPGSQRVGYLRPETAQGMFTDFPRLLRFYRDKLPFGAVQIGKSYRNEISPRQGMIRLREFTQAEAEIFVHPDRKNHPRFEKYREYTFPLLSAEQQQNDSPALLLSMGEAVSRGIVANEYVAYYLALTHELLVKIGIRPERLRFRQHLPDELAHYAADCWDAECLSDRFGWVETVGIADRTDYDLKAHSAVSGQPLTVFIQFPEPKKEKRKRIVPKMGLLGPRFRDKAKDVGEALAIANLRPEGALIHLEGKEVLIPPDCYEIREEVTEIQGTEVTPHVIEPSYGVDRMLYAVLEQSYDEDEADGEVRKVLRLPPLVAPIQVAVLPLMARDDLDTIARMIARQLQEKSIMAEYDDSGAIGRRYRRQDEVGTPYAITVDYETRDTNTVTLRERDSMRQVRIRIDDLVPLMTGLIDGSRTFSSMI